MKVSEVVTPVQASRPDAVILSGLPRLNSATHQPEDVVRAVEEALALLRSSIETAVNGTERLGLVEAADFAGHVEDLSRTVDYLQLAAAAAVDKTRSRAAAGPRAAIATPGGEAPAGWLTGWNTDSTVPAHSPSDPIWNEPGSAGASPAWVDDGYRNTADFLRARLRISSAEARRRLALAAAVLPRRGITGQPLPAAKEELAAAVAAGEVASKAATIITLSLDRVRHTSPPEDAARMEHSLTCTAVENDQDFLIRIAKRWTDALDPDGAEPGEQELRRRQGVFIRRLHRGLHHLEVFATAEQVEPLLTAMNTAANPRAGRAGGPAGGRYSDGHAETDAGSGLHEDAVTAAGAVDPAGGVEDADAAQLDRRTRPQRLLDGLVGACEAALAGGKLPAAGGLRPQVMVTIDYGDLLERLEGADTNLGPAGSHAGTLMFTGPVTAKTVRRIACDADIVPIVLGGKGRILDIGRASRVFPPHIRKAIAARDGGCAFPQCTIPASWCEAHHIDYWSRGGSTGTGNGVLLCSHHHHLIHKEQWRVQLMGGVPWFIPPPHLDPRQSPRRNRYFQLE
ncbi:HNH endonuclease signature motif containing protein [Arthrobacter sp. EPSL27]|uniref:HNH endonuclease signature motif containing protein n=1 Tax=Arthrobacter sp. EPSL27 TaxID=1745378 RepID=UPI0009E6914B|nr:HNH endonuclease signature motif containing protein [Arthrobacter sp. EPSL27]